jgi:hypothetical protein
MEVSMEVSIEVKGGIVDRKLVQKVKVRRNRACTRLAGEKE